MKTARLIASVIALALAAGTVACTSPVAPDCTDAAACHDIGPNS